MPLSDDAILSLFRRIDALEIIAGWNIARDDRSPFNVDVVQLMQTILRKDSPADPEDILDIDKQFDYVMTWVQYFTNAKMNQISTDIS